MNERIRIVREAIDLLFLPDFVPDQANKYIEDAYESLHKALEILLFIRDEEE